MNQSNHNRKAKFRPRSHHFALEARQLFDGAAFVEAAAAHAADTAAAAAPAPEAAHPAPTPTAPAADAHTDTHVVDNHPSPVAEPVTPPTDGAAHAAAEASAVYVVDKSVANWQSLVAQLPAGSDVILIDNTRSGTAQLAEALAGRTNIGALHILSHGSTDGIVLGNQALSSANLAATGADWRAIGAALSADGDILVYGCDVSAGGNAFIGQLAALTQADVAASTDATGDATQGGNWTLEQNTGSIEALAIAAVSYDGLLAAPTISDGAGSSREVLEDTNLAITGITVADTDGGAQTVTLTSTTGTLTLASIAGLTGLSGNGTGTVTFTGSISDVNTALNGMLFKGLANINGAGGFNVATFDGSTTVNRAVDVFITPVNDAPTVDGHTPVLIVGEGGQGTFTAAVNQPGGGFTQADLGLADGDNQQVQVILKLTSLPTNGTLLLNGNELAVGSTFSVAQINQLVYKHNGSQVLVATTDTFNLTIDDGAGGVLFSQAFDVRINPVNQAPATTGNIRVIEGETGVGLFANGNLPTIGTPRGFIDVTDPDQAGGTPFTYHVSSLPAVGMLFYNGVQITAGNMASIAITDPTLFTYTHDGSEPVTTGRQQTFNLDIRDDGGGTGVPTTVTRTITLDIIDNNDDPVLDHSVTQTLTDLGPGLGPDTFTVTSAMLQVTDADSFNANLTYTITSVPNTGLSYFTRNGALLQVGSTFTQADINNGLVEYHLRNYSGAERTDTLGFTVKDGGIRLYEDERDGGIYDSGTDTLSINTFNVVVPPSVGGPGGALPLPADAGVIDPQGDKAFTVNEAGSYTVTVADLTASDGNTPDNALIYRLNTLPSNGTFFRDGVALDQFGSFTQQDVIDGKVTFTHSGAEDFTANFTFSVSNGNTVTSDQVFTITATPQNDTPTATNGGRVFLGEGTSVVINQTNIVLADSDAAADAPGGTLYAEDNALSFVLTALPVNGILSLDGGVTALVVGSTVTSAQLTAGTLRYFHDGTENFTDSFKLTPVDNQGVAVTVGTNQTSTGLELNVPIIITPVNDAPVFVAKNELVAGQAGAISEGSTSIIGGVGAAGAQLVYSDTDNTDVQRQYRITAVTQHGQVLLNGVALGLGSVFTQADLNAGKVSYRHDGTENTPTDQFSYVVSDGDFSANDGGSFAQGVAPVSSVFHIEIDPSNDKPTVTVPGGTVDIDSGNPARNAITGVSVADPDLTGGVDAGETDFVQVTVRLLTSGGAPITNYTTGFGGGGVSIGYTTPADTTGLWAVTGTGSNDLLQIQGTRAQVNAALAGLSVTFANDANAQFKLQVIVDDRMRTAGGALDASGSDANGGELNQGSPAGSPATAVPGTAYNWVTQATLAATDPNITSRTIDLRASLVNEPGVLTGPATITAYEDQGLFIGGGFTISDAESEGMNTPVSVTFTVPSGQGLLSIGTLAGVTVTGSGTNTVTLSGRADLIESLVKNDPGVVGGGLTYTTPANGNIDYNGVAAGSVTLSVTFNDAGSRVGSDIGAGSPNTSPVPLAIPITILPVNDAPTVTGGGAVVPLVGATAVPGFSVGDVDVQGDIGTNPPGDLDISPGEENFMQVTVRITDVAGVPLAASAYVDGADPLITINTTTVASGATVDGTSTGSGAALVIRGTLAQVNAYLAGLQVEIEGTLANIDATYRVEVIADDRLRDVATGVLVGSANGGDNAAAGGGVQAPAVTPVNPYAATPGALVGVNVNASFRAVFPTDINDPGQITGNNVSVTEGSATVTLNAGNANLALLDPDAGSAANMTATVSVPAGFSFTAVGGTGAVTGVGTGSIVITGTQAQINSSLLAMTIQLPDEAGAPARTDWNGQFDVTVVYDDHGNTGVRPVALTGDSNDPTTGNGDYSYFDPATGSTDNRLVTTRVITVTVAPENDAPQRVGVPGVTLTPSTFDKPATAVGGSVTDLFATKFIDPLDPITGGSVSNNFYGIAIVALTVNPAEGQWQYQVDGTGAWANVGTRTTANALVLDGNDRLRFVPAADFAGTPSGITARLVENGGVPPVGGTTVDLSAGGATGGTSRYSDGANAVTLGTTVSVPSLTVIDGNGLDTGDATVQEHGIPDGDGSNGSNGTFVVNVPDGIDHITVGGTPVTLAQLTGIGGGTPVPGITTPMGVITITSYDPATGTIGYHYDLTTAQPHGGVPVTDVIAVSVTDTDGDTLGGNITVLVIDDTPTARNDAAGVQLGGPTTGVSGNVIANGGVRDVADRPGADGPITVTALAGGAVGAPLVATYGSLTLNANGSYTYTVDPNNTAVKNLYSGQTLTETFTYTITDADGDTSTATLVITVIGPDSRVPMGDQIFGGLEQNNPPIIYQPFEPAVFVQIAVQASAALSNTLSGEMADGQGVEFGAEIQSDLGGIGQDMTNTQHVSRDGVAFSVKLLAEGQSRARGMGNSLVIGAQSLFDDFSPFGPNPLAPANADTAANAQTADSGQRNDAVAQADAAAAEKIQRFGKALVIDSDAEHDILLAQAPASAPTERSATPVAAASFSAQLAAMAAAQGSVRDMASAQAVHKLKAVPVAQATHATREPAHS